MENFKKQFFILLAVSIGIFIFCLVLLWYLRNDITKTVLETNKYQQEINREAALLDKIQQLEKEAQEAEKYQIALKTVLPTETEIISLESKLKNLPAASKLNLSFRFGTLNPASENSPKNYSFNLVIDGDINDILTWLTGVQNLPYLIHFSQIEINQNNIGSANYNVKILGNIYLR